MLKDNLSTQRGVHACKSSGFYCNEWYKPDNTSVPIGTGNGVFRLSLVPEELRRITSSCTPPNCQDGIYKCVTGNDTLLLGLYDEISTSKISIIVY